MASKQHWRRFENISNSEKTVSKSEVYVRRNVAALLRLEVGFVVIGRQLSAREIMKELDLHFVKIYLILLAQTWQRYYKFDKKCYVCKSVSLFQSFLVRCKTGKQFLQCLSVKDLFNSACHATFQSYK